MKNSTITVVKSVSRSNGRQLVIKGFLPVCLSAMIIFSVSAQVPEGFNYQALARDGSGNAIALQTIGVRLTILADSLTGEIFWQELHSNVQTNAMGLFSLVVGKGLREDGTALTFEAVDWSVTPKYLMTHIIYGETYLMGSSRLWSVPYAMTAGEVTGPLKKLEVAGETSLMDEALFEVKNKNGQTVFVVYNEGVRINVGDGETSKAVKGGFAIGTFDETKAVKDVFVANADCVRVYIDGTAGKASKGGFAIGTFDETKETTDPFIKLTPENYFIGSLSGSQITTGLYNSTMGYESGRSLTSGSSNAFIGYQSGYSNSSGSGNLFLGYNTGYSNVFGNYNSFMGYMAGRSNTEGIFNTFLGSFSGHNNTIGFNNTFVGDSTGYSNTTGFFNTFLGTGCGNQNNTGSENVFIGNKSGYSNSVGEKNVFIGNFSGFANTEGHSNIMIGNAAGTLAKTGAQNVFIGTGSGYSSTETWGNVNIGFMSGYNTNTGNANVFLGANTGYSNTTGFSNVFIGINAGYTFDGDFGNTYIGDNAGMQVTRSHKNVLIGAFSGYNANLTDSQSVSNIFIGNASAYKSVGGYSNVFIGFESGYSNDFAFNNVFLGFQTGYNNLRGNDNVFLGSASGFSNTNGSSNVFIGTTTGRSNTEGFNNVFVGSEAGHKNLTGFENVYIGNASGFSSDGTIGNTFLGTYSGASLTTGHNNTFMGMHAGQGCIDSHDNTIIGGWAAADGSLGNSNLLLGHNAGRLATGSYNVFVGPGAGENNTGNGNVFVGIQAGANEKGSNKLYVNNWSGDSTETLIYGDFEKRLLRLNSSVGIGGNPLEWTNLSVSNSLGTSVLAVSGTGDEWNYSQIRLLSKENEISRNWEISHRKTNDFTIMFHDGISDWKEYLRIKPEGLLIVGESSPGVMVDVNGSARFRAVGAGEYFAPLSITSDGTLTTTTSDERLKTDIVTLSDAIQTIMALRGVRFRWLTDDSGSGRIGFIAQEVEKVLPEVVFTNPIDGYKGINYAEVTAVLTEAVKEQQRIIEEQNLEISRLRTEFEEIKSLLRASAK